MENDKVVLCGASIYTQKYYLNEQFKSLPEGIRDELQIMCVLYTEEIGGVLKLVFDEDGNLQFETDWEEGDLLYDEIGSILKIKQLQRTRTELLESLELYYKVFILGQAYSGEDV